MSQTAHLVDMNKKAQRLLEEAALILKGDVEHVTVYDSQENLNKRYSITYPYPEFPDDIEHAEKDTAKYVFGGMEVHSDNILRIIGEIEDAFKMLKYLGFEEDMIILQEMKSRYYKMYFKLAKQEKSMLD